MLGLRHVDAAEVTFSEYDPLGVKAAQVLVAEVVAVEFLFDPSRFVVDHAVQPRNGVRLFNAYSVTAINAALVEWRSRASTVMTGMSSRRANALRTASAGCLGAPSNSFIATRNGKLRASKKSTAAKLSASLRTSTRMIAPMAPRTRSSHMNQN